MSMNSRALSTLYKKAHDYMRDIDGLFPQEAFDELLKFLFCKDYAEIQKKAEGLYNKPFCERPVIMRETLSQALATSAPWTLQLWPDKSFHLSDSTLLDLQRLFSDVWFSELSLDVRSTALWTFLSPESRKSFGIFSTPEDVVRTMIEVVRPKPSDIILDPACGTGTFLLETVHFLSARKSQKGPFTVHGVDKNPRMLFLAALNLGHKSEVVFQKACADSLRELGRSQVTPLGLVPDSVDIVLTNPPFGVTISRDTEILDLFESGRVSYREQEKVPSEVLFIEMCLRLLRPEGRLGIVLPRSVITNESFHLRRRAIDKLGCLTEIIELPPETFISTGTQTTTVAAFFRKHPVRRTQKFVSVRACHVTNVGFDTTGRYRDGNQLPTLASKLSAENVLDPPHVKTYSKIPITETLQRAAHLLFRRNGHRTGKELREFIEIANTGRTPSRNAYTKDGTFILKVGNLTGRGIDWIPRDRNFVSHAEGIKRAKSHNLKLREGDILLTSSAHVARYIAKKVDVIAHIPNEYETVTFVGEIIRLRPAEGVDPFVLLAALRHASTRKDLQACVRGQTAHLHPNDLLGVRVSYDLRKPNNDLVEMADLLREEAGLAFQLHLVAMRALQLLQSTDTAPV